MTTTINEKKLEIINSFPKFDDFWVDMIEPYSNSTKIYQLSILNKIFNIIGKFDPSTFTEDDIRNLRKHEDFTRLSNKSKNLYFIILKKYLKYYDREDLVKNLKKTATYPVQRKEINKNELINREELKQILSVLNTKKRAMIMVLYEGALRRKELINIRFRDVEFEKDLVNLYIRISKTKGRNIPLQESIMYLKDYFSMEDFEPDDLIFNFKPDTITRYLTYTEDKLKKKYPKWNKHLHPHLLRHSRLTELAGSTVNEPQLRKFAGWVGGSNMPEVYFHLDDSDLKSAVFNGLQTKKQEIEQIQPIICPHCNVKNPPEAITCYKCGNIINKDKIIVGRLREREEIDALKQENKQLKEQLTKQANGFNKQMNDLKWFIGIDEDKFKDSIKERHQKLKEEKKLNK